MPQQITYARWRVANWDLAMALAEEVDPERKVTCPRCSGSGVARDDDNMYVTCPDCRGNKNVKLTETTAAAELLRTYNEQIAMDAARLLRWEGTDAAV